MTNFINNKYFFSCKSAKKQNRKWCFVYTVDKFFCETSPIYFSAVDALITILENFEWDEFAFLYTAMQSSKLARCSYLQRDLEVSLYSQLQKLLIFKPVILLPLLSFCFLEIFSLNLLRLTVKMYAMYRGLMTVWQHEERRMNIN